MLSGPKLLAAGCSAIGETEPGSGPGARWVRMLQTLDLVNRRYGPFQLVGFEEVTFATSLRQSQLWGCARGILELWAEGRRIPRHRLIGIHTGDVKTVALGKFGGKGTGKQAVLRAARRRWVGVGIPNDDAADAAWVAEAVRIGMHRLREEKRRAKKAARSKPESGPRQMRLDIRRKR